MGYAGSVEPLNRGFLPHRRVNLWLEMGGERRLAPIGLPVGGSNYRSLGAYPESNLAIGHAARI